MANFTRNGYGQVEANQLSGIKTGQIFASLPLVAEVTTLQNGEFMFYDYANGCVSGGLTANAGKGITATVGEPMLVYNEVKLYREQFETSYKDFAMIRVGDNYVTNAKATAAYGDGAENTGATIAHTDGYRMDGIAPRLVKTNVGDVFTTNMVKVEVEYAVGDILTPVKDTTSKTLVLEKYVAGTDEETNAICGLRFVVVKVYTMPDGQPGLKLQRVE